MHQTQIEFFLLVALLCLPVVAVAQADPSKDQKATIMEKNDLG